MLSWFLLVGGRTVLIDNPINVVFNQGLYLSSSGLIYPTPAAIDYTIAKTTFAAIIAEPLGTFFVAFFYLTQTEEKTVFSKEKAINCFIIASSYVGARAMLSGYNVTLSGAVLNPAIALGTSFTMLFDKGA